MAVHVPGNMKNCCESALNGLKRFRRKALQGSRKGDSRCQKKPFPFREKWSALFWEQWPADLDVCRCLQGGIEGVDVAVLEKYAEVYKLSGEAGGIQGVSGESGNYVSQIVKSM